MFSANHRQHLLVAFRHFDAALGEVLARIGAAPGTPLFQPYHDDADATVRIRTEEVVAHAREAMRSFMAKHELSVAPAEISALHAAHAKIALLQVSALELASHHLRGYGELSADECDELDELSRRLREQLIELDKVLNARGHGESH